MNELSQNPLCHTALLIIDVQRALFEKSTPIYQSDALLHNIHLLTDKAHRSGVPVIYIQHNNDNTLLSGSEGWKLHSTLNPDAADLIIQKRHGSALEDTPLHQELQSHGISTLVVTGLVTHGCVKATCLDAIKKAYHVILVADGHSNYHAQAASMIGEWNQKLKEEGAEVISTGEVDF